MNYMYQDKAINICKWLTGHYLMIVSMKRCPLISECFEEIYYQRTYSYRTTVMHFKIVIECSTIGGRGRS